jgi:membrane-bound ClpP family serine protease
MPKDEACIGSVGVLTVATRGGAGPGEVRIKIRGGTEIYRAWSETPIQRGATVLVVNDRGSRTLDVVEWEDLLGDSPGLGANKAVNPDYASDIIKET